MFNVLFGSFFGKGKDNNSNKSEDSDSYTNCDKTLTKEQLEQFEGNVKFIDLDDDDIDWLLIEKEDEDSSEENTSSKNNSDSPCLALVPFKSVFARANDDGENILLSSNLPCVYSNSMDDSWFLTPPECFTSLSTIQLESSPLENLLIEHPSMSVYGKLKKKSLTNAEVFDDLVIVELGATDKMITSSEQGRKIKKSRSSGAIPKIPTATIFVVKNTNNSNPQKGNSRAKSNQGKSAFERNNKLHLLRHAPKRTTLNQPSSRMMMTINKKK